MTSNSDSHNLEHSSPAEHLSQPPRSLDVMQRDRFEMLSAYLDGEASADERRLVENWLATDSTVQQLHARLLKLRTAFQSMPVPTSDQQAVQQTVNAVLARVDRRPRLAVIWGGVAVAAVAVGAITSTLFGDNSPLPQLAQQKGNGAQVAQTARPEPLLIALDKPLVSIPKTPVADSNDQPPIVPTRPTDDIR